MAVLNVIEADNSLPPHHLVYFGLEDRFSSL